MNNVTLLGRLTRDVTVRTASGGLPVARYTLAVDRRFKRDGEPEADFISCVAFGRQAEFAKKYFDKGIRICVFGHIQTGSYIDKNGVRVYTTDVVVEHQEFADSIRDRDIFEESPVYADAGRNIDVLPFE